MHVFLRPGCQLSCTEISKVEGVPKGTLFFFIEPGQLFHCHRDCEAAARVCQKRQGNCPKCPQKASVKPRKSVSDVAEHPPDHFLEVECDEEDTEIHVDFGLAGVAEAIVLLVVFHLSEDGLRLYRPSAAPE